MLGKVGIRSEMLAAVGCCWMMLDRLATLPSKMAFASAMIRTRHVLNSFTAVEGATGAICEMWKPRIKRNGGEVKEIVGKPASPRAPAYAADTHGVILLPVIM